MRELLEQTYDVIKDLKKKIEVQRDKLERNRQAISIDGLIPEKYQKAFSKLENEIKALESRLTACMDILGPLEEAYIFSEISGNLYFEKGEGSAPFVEKAHSLRETKTDEIRSATMHFDVDELDKVLFPLRQTFVHDEFDAYTEYAKTLSINKVLAH